LVYGAQYDKEIHSSPDLPGFDPSKRVYLSIDWGGTNPFSIGVWQKFPRIGWVRVEEVYQGNTTNQHILAECRARPWWKKIYEAVADPARPDLIREWGAAGIDIVKAINDVSPGIEAVRVALKPVIGNPTIHINPICRALRRELGQYYEKHGKPVDENNHACFVAGTVIEAERGHVPIEDIKVGENVWTRSGLRKVTEAGMTNPAAEVLTAHFSDGRTLTATPDHPIWTEGGWKRLDSIHGLRTFQEKEKRPVYNLTVSGAHEFYANGILVSNCDDLRYFAMRYVRKGAGPHVSRI
jgi:hypothetical protein